MKTINFIFLLLCLSLNAQEVNYQIKNVQSNTKFQDFGVTFFGENEIVYASTRRDKSRYRRNWNGNKQPYLELYKGVVTPNGDIIDVESFSNKLNTKYHEANVTFTKNNETVYFTRNNYLNRRVKRDSAGIILNQIYRAQIDDSGRWRNIEPMPFNDDNYQTGHPVLNENEDKLYFVSDMPGGYGATDIYVVDIYEDGSFGVPRNLGPTVNTSKKEMFPYIDDKDVLYFASNGFNQGLGGLDIYASRIIENRVVGPVVNLGYPVNSESDDFSIVFDKGKRLGYFSSNREGGIGDDDIYYFVELNPLDFTESDPIAAVDSKPHTNVDNCNQLVHGMVLERQDRKPLQGVNVNLKDASNNLIKTIITDKSGKFSFNLNCKQSYKIEGSYEDYYSDRLIFESGEKVHQDLELILIDKKKLENSGDFTVVNQMTLISVKPIHFDLNRSNITKEAAIELEEVIRIMNKYPKIKIELGAHTDSRGSNNYNLSLSKRRAKESKAYLVKRGIDPLRIKAEGFGESKLLNNCSNGVKCNEIEHLLNRRTEFIILNPEVITLKDYSKI